MAVERMKAQTIWLTGLPCAGKTTLATLLFRSLLAQGVTNVECWTAMSCVPIFQRIGIFAGGPRYEYSTDRVGVPGPD
jgi:thymidylate kinase